MPDDLKYGSPEWWLHRLGRSLAERRQRIAIYEQYYEGKHRLAFATSKFREAFGKLFAAFADNWCDLVVDASVERLAVEGFRFDGRDADERAWDVWQANGLDADSVIAHTEAVKCGEAYVLVAPGDELPQLTVEHPAEAIVENVPGSRRQRAAALKQWREDDGRLRATLYLPTEVFRFRSKKPEEARKPARQSYDARDDHRVEWELLDEDGRLANPLGVVPMVPLLNNPTMRGGGQSDIAKVIPMQDAINKLVTDMIVASEYAAYRQRYATGIEIPKDPETGKPRPESQFLSDFSRIWTVGAPDVKFGEFSASDLGNYVKAVEMLVQHVAAQTRTPPHYLLGQSGAFPSGESLQSTETGLVAKVSRKQLSFGETWEEVMRLAFKLVGDEERAAATAAETIWRDPESRSFGELVDGLVKLQTIGVPNEVLWERAGFSPQEIARMKTIAMADDLLALSSEPTRSPNGQPVPVA